MKYNSLSFKRLQEQEFRKAVAKYGAVHGYHDGYAKIAEELDEFWEIVRMQGNKRCDFDAALELAQIAAMCERTAIDLALLP